MFLNFLGVPVGGSGVRRPIRGLSLRLRHTSVRRRRSATRSSATRHAGQGLGIVALRLMEGDAIPLDFRRPHPPSPDTSARSGAAWSRRRGPGRRARSPPRAGTAAAASRRRDTAVEAGRRSAARGPEPPAMSMERAFTDPDGLRERPWYRHLLHAPESHLRPAEVLPGSLRRRRWRCAAGSRTRPQGRACAPTRLRRRCAAARRESREFSGLRVRARVRSRSCTARLMRFQAQTASG